MEQPASALVACRLRLLIAGAAVVFISLTGCDNDDARLGIPLVGPLPGAEVSLRNDVQPIFELNCAIPGCHAGSVPKQNMSLEASDTFDLVVGIVDIDSVQVPALKRVRPGSSSQSYLVNKIEGTAGSVGGNSSRMPLNAPALAASEIRTIRDWIDQGANDN
ncbi:MAG: hypothetical protein V3U98_08510 [Acidobacteriota bacterium]